MTEETFELLFTPYRDPRKYRLLVEVIHRSGQIVRFRISAGGKSMVMEKQVGRKKGSWKIPEINFSFGRQKIKDMAFTIFELQNKLDEYLDKEKRPPSRNPKYEH